MGLVMFLQILRPLESLVADRTSMRLVWDVDADMRCDVIPLHGFRLAVCPVTLEVEVVGRFAANVTITYVFLISEPGQLFRSWLSTQALPRICSRREFLAR